jgi:hypothetical protein
MSLDIRVDPRSQLPSLLQSAVSGEIRVEYPLSFSFAASGALQVNLGAPTIDASNLEISAWLKSVIALGGVPLLGPVLGTALALAGGPASAAAALAAGPLAPLLAPLAGVALPLVSATTTGVAVAGSLAFTSVPILNALVQSTAAEKAAAAVQGATSTPVPTPSALGLSFTPLQTTITPDSFGIAGTVSVGVPSTAPAFSYVPNAPKTTPTDAPANIETLNIPVPCSSRIGVYSGTLQLQSQEVDIVCTATNVAQPMGFQLSIAGGSPAAIGPGATTSPQPLSIDGVSIETIDVQPLPTLPGVPPLNIGTAVFNTSTASISVGLNQMPGSGQAAFSLQSSPGGSFSLPVGIQPIGPDGLPIGGPATAFSSTVYFAGFSFPSISAQYQADQANCANLATGAIAGTTQPPGQPSPQTIFTDWLQFVVSPGAFVLDAQLLGKLVNAGPIELIDLLPVSGPFFMDEAMLRLIDATGLNVSPALLAALQSWLQQQLGGASVEDLLQRMEDAQAGAQATED